MGCTVNQVNLLYINPPSWTQTEIIMTYCSISYRVAVKQLLLKIYTYIRGCVSANRLRIWKNAETHKLIFCISYLFCRKNHLRISNRVAVKRHLKHPKKIKKKVKKIPRTEKFR